MRNLLAIVALSLIVACLGCTKASRISSLAIPDETVKETTPVDVAAYSAKYANCDGVMLDVEQTIEHSGAKGDGFFDDIINWKYNRVYREKYIVLNPEARWLTTFGLSYMPDKLYMNTVSPNGLVSHFGPGDLDTVVDGKGSSRFKIAFPKVEIGTVVEIGWETGYNVRSYLPPLDHDITLQYRIPCEHIKFTYGYPNWWRINVKRLSDTRDVAVKYVQAEEAKKTLLVYEASDVPALRQEPYSPPFREVATYLQFMVTDLMMKGFKHSPPISWEKLAADFRKYAIKKADKRPKQVTRFVDSLVAGVDSKLERLKRIVACVSSRTEPDWFGNNGDPGKTFSRKSGNRYDITGLTQTMLSQAGINSDYLLVHARKDGWFDAAYVSPDQLYTPALHAVIDSADYLVLPWIRHYPVTEIPDSYRGETALLISEEAAGKSWNAPRGSDQDDQLRQGIEVTIDTAGAVAAHHTYTHRGTQAYNIRRMLDELNHSERRKLADSLLLLSGADLVMDTFAFVGDTNYYQPLTTVFNYHFTNAVTTTPEEIIVRTTDLLSPAAGSERPDTLERQNPICIERPEIMTKQVTITYPMAWTLTTVLEPYRVENQFGVLECNYETQPGTIVCSQHLSLKEISAPKEQIADLVALVGSGVKGSVPALVFRR